MTVLVSHVWNDEMVIFMLIRCFVIIRNRISSSDLIISTLFSKRSQQHESHIFGNFYRYFLCISTFLLVNGKFYCDLNDHVVNVCIRQNDKNHCKIIFLVFLPVIEWRIFRRKSPTFRNRWTRNKALYFSQETIGQKIDHSSDCIVRQTIVCLAVYFSDIV